MPPATAWHSLGVAKSELTLKFTLPTGQSFRWRQTRPDEYTGVIGKRVVQARQLDDDVQWRVIGRTSEATEDGDQAAIADYFNLHICLTDKAAEWAAKDQRFGFIAPHINGCRVLRQSPVECAFQFICSSNNHISRIHGMVERLCKQYGAKIAVAEGAVQAEDGVDLPSFHAFPTVQQLLKATESDLRAAGFGYRARYIVGSAAALAEKPEGGEAWLLSLREKSYEETCEALCSLPGVGPKVAACVALFSCDKHAAIPVDTHVWALACKYYTPHLRNKTLTPKLHSTVMQAFCDVFGEYAGWAHNALFISELASHQHLLPGQRRQRGAKRSRDDEAEDDSADEQSDVQEEAASGGASATADPVVAARVSDSGDVGSKADRKVVSVFDRISPGSAPATPPPGLRPAPYTPPKQLHAGSTGLSHAESQLDSANSNTTYVIEAAGGEMNTTRDRRLKTETDNIASGAVSSKAARRRQPGRAVKL